MGLFVDIAAYYICVVMVVVVRIIHSKHLERDQRPAVSEWWQHGLLHQRRTSYSTQYIVKHNKQLSALTSLTFTGLSF